MFLAGEWVPSNLLFSLAFLVAGAGCAGLGAWVLRGDRRNRALLEEQHSAELLQTTNPPVEESQPEPDLEASAQAVQQEKAGQEA